MKVEFSKEKVSIIEMFTSEPFGKTRGCKISNVIIEMFTDRPVGNHQN